MNNSEFLALAKQELDTVLSIIEAKNSDYTAGSDDPFANFKMCEKLELADAEIGVLVRMVDKIQRVKSFIKNGELQVKNESVNDALRDIIGYSLVLLGMVESAIPKLAQEESYFNDMVQLNNKDWETTPDGIKYTGSGELTLTPVAQESSQLIDGIYNHFNSKKFPHSGAI